MIVTRMKVLKVEERFRRRWVSGAGPDAVFREESLGWFVIMDGGTMSMGSEEPQFAAGDVVRLSIGKIDG